jgi:chromosome segregation ATPase
MSGVDLNGFASGGLGTLVVGVIAYLVKLVADRLIPTKTDKRGDVAQAFDVLKEISSILRAEKKEDAERLAAKQSSIERLEGDGERDYTTIRQLRAEVAELERRLQRKDLHIQQLTLQIERLGAHVIVHNDDIEIAMPLDAIRQHAAESKEKL